MRNIRSLFLIFFSVAAGGGFAGRAVGADTLELLRRGVDALGRRDPAAAEPLLDRAARQAKDDGDWDAYAMAANARGVALRRQGRFLEAEAAFVGVLTVGGGGIEGAVYANLGLTRLDLRRFSQAREALEWAVALLSDTVPGADVLTSMARLHHELRDWALAETAYSEALSIYLAAGRRGPQTALCRNGLGAVAFETGRLREAERHFEAALDDYGVDPARALPLANLGRTALALGELGRAEALLHRALDLQHDPLHPQSAAILGFLAETAAARGDKRATSSFTRRRNAVLAEIRSRNGNAATVDLAALVQR